MTTNLPLIVDASDLASALLQGTGASAEPLKIIDLRPEEAFVAGHIPGARRLDARLLNRVSKPFAGLLPDEAGIRELIVAAQLRPTDHVVAVDAGAATEAARLLWVLHTWGFTQTSWLNGGMRAWLDHEGGLETGMPDATTPCPTDDLYSPVLTGAPCTSADSLQTMLGHESLRILDVRSRAEFVGDDVRSAEGGHIPGAQHLEWTTLLANDGRLRDRSDLLSELRSLDVQPDHTVVAYCQSHQRSAVTWLVLKSLGFPTVSGLDGAWSVWGNRPELPKER